MEGVEFVINEEFISFIIGLSMDGRKFFKERKSKNEAMDQFFKDNEWEKLIKKPT